MLKRTNSTKFKRQSSSFEGVKVDVGEGKRKIKAKMTIRFHGAQNVPFTSNEVAQLQWKRGSKKQNSGKTAEVDVVFGMVTWKHLVDMEVTFVQNKTNKDVEAKVLNVSLNVGSKGKKLASLGTISLDLADFYRDATKVDRILAVTQGSNPVTLNVSIETRWTHIDNKLIVRGKTLRNRKPGETTADEEDSYDLKTVTFDSEDELSVAGDDGGKIEFSSDQEHSDDNDGDGAGGAAFNEQQVKELQAAKMELTAAKISNEHLLAELKAAEGKIETYRAAIKTKNDQIADLKSNREDRATQAAGAEAKVSAWEEKVAALQANVNSLNKALKEREDRNESERQRFEKELRELRARNEDLHAKLTAETASNAQFLATIEKQSAEQAALLKAEKLARKKVEKELEEVLRREQSFVAELEEAVPEAIGPEVVVPSSTSPAASDASSGSSDAASAGKMQNVGNAVVDAIRTRRRAEQQAKDRKSASPVPQQQQPQVQVQQVMVEDTASKEEAARLAAELKTVRAELAAQKAQVADLQDRLSSSASAHDAELSRLLTDRDGLKRKLQETEGRVKVLERETASQKDETEALRKRNLALAESVRESLEARAVANSALLEMRETQSKLAAEIGAKQRELSGSAAAQAARLDELRSQAAAKLQEQEQAHVQQTEAFRDQIKRLEQILDEKDKKIVELETAAANHAANAAAAAAPAPPAASSSAGDSVTPRDASTTTPRDLKPGTLVDAALALGKGVGGAEAAALREAFTRQRLELERIAERAREDVRRAEEEGLRQERRANNLEKALAEARKAADEAKRRTAELEAECKSAKEAALENQQVLESAEKEFMALSHKASGFEAKLQAQTLDLQQRELQIASQAKSLESALQEVQAVSARAALAEQSVEETQKKLKEELAASRDRLTELRAELRSAEDKAKSAEQDKEQLQRRVAVLESELEVQRESERETSQHVVLIETKLRASTRAAQVAEEETGKSKKRITQLEADLQAVRASETNLKRELQVAKEDAARQQTALRAEVSAAAEKSERLAREVKDLSANVTQTEATLVSKAKAEVEAVETQLKAVRAELAEEKQRAASLELQVEGKTTTNAELVERISKLQSQVDSERTSASAALAAERQRSEEMFAQIASLKAVETELKRQVQIAREEQRAADEHARATDEMLDRKNKNLATLEAEVQSAEAEVTQMEGAMSLLKKQLAELKLESQAEHERAEAASVLATQLQQRLDQAAAETASQRERTVAAASTLELAASEARKAQKEAERQARSAEAERDRLRAQCTEMDATVRAERAKAESAQATVERLRSVEEELASAKTRLQQMREASGSLAERVEQAAQLEKERRERKLVISSVLLATTDENAAELSSKAATAIVESLVEWGSLSGEGDASCLNKIANGYSLLLGSNESSYYHCIRVLSQLCTLSHALRKKTNVLVNDPSVSGVIITNKKAVGATAIEEFALKIDGVTERSFVAVGTAIFRRIKPYLAPAILNHMPAIDSNRIEETVVDSGNERGKFMSHTVISTLTDVRDWITRFALPDTVTRQLFATLAYNLNAYLFQYLIQTPSICVPSNAFTIKTRLQLLADWFSQPRNAVFGDVHWQLRPLEEAAVLLFVDRSSFTSWDTIRGLCPSLNSLQVLSLVEMMSVDEVQRQPLPPGAKEGVDANVHLQDEAQSLFNREIAILPLEEVNKAIKK